MYVGRINMIDIKNVLEVINEVVILPIAIITFLLIIYIIFYLWRKDPDIIRARIFLKYHEFKKVFLILAIFAFILIFHVSLIYLPHFFLMENIILINDLQQFFGLVLAITLSLFVYLIYRSIKC